MSVLIKDKTTGEWEQVAGNGKAEYGASTVRKGTFVYSLTDNLPASKTITFDSAMPDSDYLLEIDTGSPKVSCGNITKSASGFTCFLRNNDSEGVAARTFSYTAFKLYTDTEYNPLLDLPDRVEALETVSTMTVTKQGNYINGTNFYGRKIGKVATIEIDGATGSSIPWGQATIVGITTGCATGIIELNCTVDILNIVTGYDVNGNAITRYIPPYCRSWIDTAGQINVFLENPGSADTSYTKNLFIGGSYIIQ